MEDLERLNSGIPGLDMILAGGLVAGASYIIQGRPGSGKTILANQIAFHRAAQGHKVLFATLLAESHDRLFQFLSTLSFFDRERVGSEIHYVSAFDTLQSEGPEAIVTLLRRECVKHNASLMVVDGLVNALNGSDTRIDAKRFIARLQGHAAFAGCTVLFLTSSGIEAGNPGMETFELAHDGQCSAVSAAPCVTSGSHTALASLPPCTIRCVAAT